MKPRILLKSRKALGSKQTNPFTKSPRSRLSKVTFWSLIVVALASVFLLLLPYIPRLSFWISRPTINADPYKKAAQATKAGGTTKNSPEVAKPGNRLILPDIGVDTQIIEGKSLNVIGKNQGVWRETNKINPSTPGNMVIAGHRFLYTATNGGWFYNLPELKIGEKIYVKWDNKIYEYEVYNTRSVLPTQTDVRDNDLAVSKKLTMYTCYPLGSTAKRFVVEAKQL